jgi:glutamate dehydrogenase (NAD(P)+)
MSSEPRSYTVHIPEFDLHGWLAVDSVHQGMAFGGTRFSLDVTRSEVEELARCMSWKLAVHGSPVGGAKAGLCCDPADHRLPELLAAFAQALEEPLTSHVVIGKDLGASNEMLDTIYAALGIPQMHVAQRRAGGEGTPDRLRNLGGYQSHMTGLGIAWSIQALEGPRLDGMRVAIQGFGAVGAGAAVRLSALGAQVVAVSDIDGAVLHPYGLELSRLLAAQQAGGRLVREALGPHQSLHRDSLFEVDCDLLVLGAASHSVQASHADRICAARVVEGANFGLTEDARLRLHERGVQVIPDILANSSSAAMVALQMASGNRLSDATLWSRIEDAIQSATRHSASRASAEATTLREAWIQSL